jgi:hypothetical protein
MLLIAHIHPQTASTLSGRISYSILQKLKKICSLWVLGANRRLPHEAGAEK